MLVTVTEKVRVWPLVHAVGTEVKPYVAWVIVAVIGAHC